jgi:hypothetical protein
MSTVSKRIAWIGALATLLSVLPTATAFSVLDEIFFVEVCQHGTHVGSFSADYRDGVYDPGTGVFRWSLDADKIIRDAVGTPVARVRAGKTFVEVQTASGAGRDTESKVNLNFSVVAGDALTDFTIKSALLNVDPILDAEGRASAAFTLTDGIGDDGATLTPLDGVGAFRAEYNGFVPGGSPFTKLIPEMAADPMSFADLPQDFPGGGAYAPIGDDVVNLSTMVSFSLTPNDLASGTSIFEVVPEPGSLLLLAICAGLRRLRGR